MEKIIPCIIIIAIQYNIPLKLINFIDIFEIKFNFITLLIKINEPVLTILLIK